MQDEFTQKTPVSRIVIWVVFVILLFLLGIMIGYYYNQETKVKNQGDAITLLPSPVQTAKPVLENKTADWKTYTNDDLGVSFKYPQNWQDVILVKHDNPIKSLKGNYFSNPGEEQLQLFDPEKIFAFWSYSQDYQPFGFVILNNSKINVNWNRSEFVKNMNIQDRSLLFVKKLNDKSVLVALYEDYECSPTMNLKVLVPLNVNYPNFEIQIGYHFEEDPSVKDFIKQAEKNQADACDMHDVYKKIADKINDGTYSDKLNEYINTAKMIAETIENTK